MGYNKVLAGTHMALTRTLVEQSGPDRAPVLGMECMHSLWMLFCFESITWRRVRLAIANGMSHHSM